MNKEELVNNILCLWQEYLEVGSDNKNNNVGLEEFINYLKSRYGN